MPNTKQRKKPNVTTPAKSDDCLDIDHEIELGLKVMADKARQGDPQALKLLMAYKDGKQADRDEPDFRDLTELERRKLEVTITKEIISLRSTTDNIEDS